MSDHNDDHEIDSRHRGRSARLIGAAMLAGAIIVGAGCGAAPSDVRPEPADAVLADDAAGSDRHLELHAVEIAGRVEADTVSGSDRHLELRAVEIARGAEAGTVSGSDRHLELRAVEIARGAEADTVSGSDRHLEMQAKEVAARHRAAAGS